MTLLFPTALVLFILIPLAMFFLLWRDMFRRRALQRMGNDALVQSLISQVNITRRRIKSTLWLLTLSLLILSLTHPIWGVSAEIVQAEGVAIVFLIDVSRSMDAQDIAPSRLERAKIDIKRIASELEDSDIGFIAFAGEPFVYMPMTYDQHSIETFLNAIGSRATTRQGTDIYPAITMAVNLLEKHSAATKRIIILSDGENHELGSQDGLQLARENAIIIDTIAYGTAEGATIPLYAADGSITGYQADASGAIVTTQLEPEILQEIALSTGGSYTLSANNTDLIERLITTLQSAATGSLGDRVYTREIERFGIFLLLALMTLSLEILLPENRGAKST